RRQPGKFPRISHNIRQALAIRRPECHPNEAFRVLVLGSKEPGGPLEELYAAGNRNRAVVALTVRFFRTNIRPDDRPFHAGTEGMSAPENNDNDIPTTGESTGFQPYIPPEAAIPEFTWGPIIIGVVLGIIFGASSLYLLLKVGMTVSASVPIAVLSITLFR